MSKGHITEHLEPCGNPYCELCKSRKPFILPNEIADATTKGKLVIFAGAGISTEAKRVFKTTLCEDIKRELGIHDPSDIGFSKLMTQFCTLRSRRELLQKIKHRFDYMKMFPEVYRWATRFHRQLSTIPQIQEIVTTNWDDLFERECDATPVVTSADFAAFSDIPGRKVLKLHGSVTNYGSMVITEEDYEKCYEKLKADVIGAKLRVLLASKTVLFVGYSFGDEDFKRVYQTLNEEVKQLLPDSFLVTLDENAKSTLSSLGMSVTPIVTDATYFVEVLKEFLVSKKLMMPDERFEGIGAALQKVQDLHFELSDNVSIATNPEAIFSLAYQDGLLHAFEGILAKMSSGVFSDEHHVSQMTYRYEKLSKEFLDDERYVDVAYIEGYRNGLLYLAFTDEDRRKLPMYWLFGCKEEIRDFDRYTQLAKSARKLHRRAYDLARMAADDSHIGPQQAFHHIPFL